MLIYLAVPGPKRTDQGSELLCLMLIGGAAVFLASWHGACHSGASVFSPGIIAHLNLLFSRRGSLGDDLPAVGITVAQDLEAVLLLSGGSSLLVFVCLYPVEHRLLARLQVAINTLLLDKS
jgi:hypothetical protein